MQKKILTYIQAGRIQTALGKFIPLAKKDGNEFYNEAIQISSRFNRAQRGYDLNLISFEEQEKAAACTVRFIMDYLRDLKKKHFNEDCRLMGLSDL